MIPGGHEAFIAFWEATACFVHGFFLGTILLAQASLEHLLAGALLMADPSRPTDARP